MDAHSPLPPHLRGQIFHVLHKPSPHHRLARYVNYLLGALIVANAAVVSLETIPSLRDGYRLELQLFEGFSTAIFLIEYLLRLWTCVEQGRFSAPISGRLRYAIRPLPLLDLIVVVSYPFPLDLRFLRVARLFRLVRVFHLSNFEHTLQEIGSGLARRSSLITVAFTSMIACIYATSALIYQLEHAAQPAIFTSIPATFWWAIATLTTIGYGDMVPITSAGRICTGLISVFGIGVFALPMAIVTAVILESGNSDKPSHHHRCPHCGQRIEAE